MAGNKLLLSRPRSLQNTLVAGMMMYRGLVMKLLLNMRMMMTMITFLIGSEGGQKMEPIPEFAMQVALCNFPFFLFFCQCSF